MEILIVIGSILLWYMSGLLGSHLAMKNSKVLNWKDDLGFALCMAVFGPINLLSGIFCYIWWGLQPNDY